MDYDTQNNLLLNKLMQFYNKDNNFEKMLNIINGQSNISLRIVDWFATNYSKKNYTVYIIESKNERFKVYNDYKLKLKAYSKKRFDPFCRWERITIPFNDKFIQTTIGQLNFFKWALENEVIKYIEENYDTIDNDMNNRNSINKVKNYSISSTDSNSSSDSLSSNSSTNKTRKKREELSTNASKSIKKEELEIVVKLS
tara:strand:- start:653 stop:1246 length:594 start_codon:yes stop_codon:yes gene_type:complete